MVEYLKISGIDQMIPMDYVGFATVYDDHHVVINGGATIGRSMDEKQIQQQILMHFGDIQSVGTGGKYSDVIEEGTFNIIITLIRKHRNYSAYFILCKMDDPFTERDLHTAIFITNTANELLALNYTVLQEKRELQNLYDSIPTLITTLDTEGRIVSLNKAAEAIVGDRKQHIGHTMRNFLSEDKFQRFMPIYNEAIKTRKPIECMVKFHAINGKTVTNEMVIAPLISRKGEVTGVVFYGTDVTEKRVYEKEIEQLRQYALLGELSANIAHDIKNPLAGIHAVARLLQKGSSDNEDTVELLDDIINAVGRINNTVEQLLS
ncbi:MAG: PAS domain-containing protein, partial [Clostridiales Family XIII bacterium]|nr:PAS domain-containing protein [Clostridiales Family XIII bacterium]